MASRALREIHQNLLDLSPVGADRQRDLREDLDLDIFSYDLPKEFLEVDYNPVQVDVVPDSMIWRRAKVEDVG